MIKENNKKSYNKVINRSFGLDLTNNLSKPITERLNKKDDISIKAKGPDKENSPKSSESETIIDGYSILSFETVDELTKNLRKFSNEEVETNIIREDLPILYYGKTNLLNLPFKSGKSMIDNQCKYAIEIIKVLFPNEKIQVKKVLDHDISKHPSITKEKKDLIKKAIRIKFNMKKVEFEKNWPSIESKLIRHVTFKRAVKKKKNSKL